MEPWFDGNIVGGSIGGILGIFGGLLGCAGGFLVPKAKCRQLVIGFMYSAIVICLALTTFGVIALVEGQPKHVWYALLHPGLLGATLIGAFIPMIKKRYKEAELRIMSAQDL